jgi:hypothetical protein
MPASTIQQIGIKLLAKIVASVHVQRTTGFINSYNMCLYNFVSTVHPRRVRQKWPGRKEVNLPDSLDLRALFSWVDTLSTRAKASHRATCLLPCRLEIQRYQIRRTDQSRDTGLQAVSRLSHASM